MVRKDCNLGRAWVGQEMGRHLAGQRSAARDRAEIERGRRRGWGTLTLQETKRGILKPFLGLIDQGCRGYGEEARGAKHLQQSGF